VCKCETDNNNNNQKFLSFLVGLFSSSWSNIVAVILAENLDSRDPAQLHRYSNNTHLVGETYVDCAGLVETYRIFGENFPPKMLGKN
jgi:hypothetical protein